MIEKISVTLLPEYSAWPKPQHFIKPYPRPIIKQENPKDPMIRVIVVDHSCHFG
jgi:hypothetical protein